MWYSVVRYGKVWYMKWCEITCWLEELPHALLFYFCCLSCADQHPLVKNRYTMRTQIFSKRYRMTPILLYAGLEITADQRSMIGRKLFLIGEEATLPFILIGKKYIWPLSEEHAYLYAVKDK